MKKHSFRSASPLVLAGLLLFCIPAFALATSGASPAEVLHLTGDPCGSFGFSVAGVGDFNGDGHQDFAVSEPFGGPIISIYWGGPRVDSVADFRLRTGDPSHDAYFGALIASAGDFNGDGFDDVVASVWGGSNRFYVFYGGQIPDSLPDLSLSFPAGLSSPAAVVAGDVNHDGYSDLVVGYEEPFTPGRVFVYFGGRGADELPDLELTATPNDLLVPSGIGPARGSKLAMADVNGDGIPDVIVDSASGLRVYYGGTSMDGLEDLRLSGSTIAGQKIRGIASAGDVNGDGAEDVMVATAAEEDTWVRGRVQIFYGGAGMDSIPDVTLHAQDATTIFGPAMISLGDTNGDGYDDVLVGTNFDSAGGQVNLFLGGTPMDTTAAASITSSVAGTFGEILGAADVNGDGVLDAVVSLSGLCTGNQSDVLAYDFSTPLPARAFVQGGNRTIHLGKTDSQVCIRLEPVGHSYEIIDIDMPSIRLTTELGSIKPIPLSILRRAVVGDTDRNGLSEIPVYFASADLGILFGSIKGRTVGHARLEGRLTSLRRFAAPVTLMLIGEPARSPGLAATLAPNPMNPVGTLKFTTYRPGKASIRVYNVAGQLVRTALFPQELTAGEHSVTLDGRDDEGAELGSGVYFYGVETTEGKIRGRFVIAR